MTTSTRARYRDVFSEREFRVLFSAHLASLLGDVVASVALMVLIYARTGSPALAAATMSLSFLPYLFGGAVMAGVIERWPPRATMVIAQLCSAGLVLAMTIPGLPVLVLLVLLFGVGLCAPLIQGVRAVLLPRILAPGPPYVLGRSVLRIVAQSAQVVGYGLGGLLVVVVSARGALGLDAASFGVSAVLVGLGTVARPPLSAAPGPSPAATVPGPSPAATVPGPLPAGGAPGGGATRPASMVRSSLESLHGVFSVPALRRVLLLGWLVPACSVAPEALAAPYVASLHRSASAVGWYLAAGPVGTVIADVVAARLLPSRLQTRLVVPAAVLACAPLVLFSLRPALSATLVVLLVAGVGSAYGPGLDQRLIQVAPAGRRDNALALSSAGLMFIQGVGFAVWGIAAEFLPIRVVVPVAAGLGLAAVAFLGARLGDRPRRV